VTVKVILGHSQMEKDFILYGMQASLYTGKARAYMRRNRIPVTERGAGHPDYTGRISPHMLYHARH